MSQFKNKSEYKKLEILEKNSDLIISEYEAISHIKMRDWPESFKYDGSWKVFGFYHLGRKMKSLCKYCPKTVEIIESIGEVSMAGFSKMSPNTNILEHVDDVEQGLFRVHLGINIPNGDCGIWVDGEEKKWKNGEAFLFDPLKIHKAWNKTEEERVILLLDFKKIS